MTTYEVINDKTFRITVSDDGMTTREFVPEGEAATIDVLLGVADGLVGTHADLLTPTQAIVLRKCIAYKLNMLSESLHVNPLNKWL